MCEVINFSLVNQYKLLYIIPNSGNRIYHIWGNNIDELNIIGKIIKNKDKLQDFGFGFLSDSCKIRKFYMPIPDYLKLQLDGFYHAYLKFETY